MLAKLKFLGSGSAFSLNNYQTNMILTAPSGKKMLIDCGTDIRFSIKEAGLSHRDIDAVYISHCHADHIGGIEWLAFLRYFDKGAGGPPHLYMIRHLMHEAWEHTMQGGLESIEGKVMNITDYFNCHGIDPNHSFVWEGLRFTPVQTVHVVNGFKIMSSYGLLVKDARPEVSLYNKQTFITTDTQFAPHQLAEFYKESDYIFHDAETAPYFSGVHAHYDRLKELAPEIKKKMWLSHYQDEPKQDAVKDGFAGFVKKGQEFCLEIPILPGI